MANPELVLYADIGAMFPGGVTPKDVKAKLDALPKGCRALDVRINSAGGSVYDGLAIYELLKACKCEVTCYVDGLAASIASIIALAGSRVVMAPTATMMIHNPSLPVYGTADDLRKGATALDVMTNKLVAIYQAKTGLPEADIRALMAAETFFTADEAQGCKMADAVTREEAKPTKATCHATPALDAYKAVVARMEMAMLKEQITALKARAKQTGQPGSK